MPRKKRPIAEAISFESADTATATATAVAEAPPTPAAEPTTEPVVEPVHGKNWGPPYKAIFSCPTKGFEMGENRRYVQRVFMFHEKPEEHILATLKDHGFIYRAAEKAWTIHATADTRKLSDDLARQFAGKAESQLHDQGAER